MIIPLVMCGTDTFVEAYVCLKSPDCYTNTAINEMIYRISG